MESINVGAAQHLAVPTKGQSVLHEGKYADRCAECSQVIARIARTFRLLGRAVPMGSMVRVVPQQIPTGYPEWVTVTDMSVNSHIGQVWMHAFEWGQNLIIEPKDIAELLTPADLDELRKWIVATQESETA